MTAQKRITYFDIAKGLMILGLLVSHFSIVKTHLGMKYDLRYLDMFITTYSGFFMQCFFFITGFCSSFTIDAKKFFTKLFRQLLLPLCFFDVINQILFFCGVNFACNVFSPPLYLTSMWFVRALILAKIIVWTIRKISKSDYILLVVTFALLVVGGALNELHIFTKDTEFFCYCHGMLASFFVALGNYFKRHRHLYDFFMKYGWVVYVAVLFIRYVSKTTIFQSFDANINFGLSQIVPMLILTVSGLFACLMLAKIIGNNRTIEFFGRNSLVVYCTHIIPLFYISKFVYHNLNIACEFNGTNYLLFLTVFVLTSAVMAFFIILLTKTPLRICIGK